VQNSQVVVLDVQVQKWEDKLKQTKCLANSIWKTRGE
jgi:hypothetical protein